MKKRKCPYCGRRITYTSAFASRRKGEYVCTRCSRESKVVVSGAVIAAFAAFAAASLAIMAGFIFTDNINNPFGALLVAVPLIIFLFLSPVFVRFEPLKKYKKTMEARKAGIEYSDNLSLFDLEPESRTVSQAETETTGFKINSDVFNKIRAERNAARAVMKENSGDDSDAESAAAEGRRYVSVIENVSENHASDSVPLRKIHSDRSRSSPKREAYYESEIEEEPAAPKEKNRYTGNRKF